MSRTHGHDVPLMSTLFEARQYRASVEEGAATGAASSTPAAEERRKMKMESRRASGKRWSWTWKAYLNINGTNGRKLDAVLGARMSAEFRALSADEQAFYEDIGEAAYDRWRQGLAAFGPRKRRKTITNEQPLLWCQSVLTD